VLVGRRSRLSGKRYGVTMEYRLLVDPVLDETVLRTRDPMEQVDLPQILVSQTDRRSMGVNKHQLLQRLRERKAILEKEVAELLRTD